MKKLAIMGIFLCLALLELAAIDYPAGSPQFSSTSGEKVLFRYKFNVGQKVTMDINMDSVMKASSKQGTMEMPFKMTFQASYTVNSVLADGNAQATLMITRMTMKAEGAANISYDSSDPAQASNPQFASSNIMINAPIPVVISPLGELVSVDTNPLMEAAKKLGSQINQNEFEQQLKEITESSFIQLSEKPLKAGEAYEAGTLSTSLGDANSMTAKVKYEVIAVSGDKKQAILKPIVAFSFPGMSVKKSDFSGWILFDLEKGNIKESFARQLLEMEMPQEGDVGLLTIDMGISFKTDI
jgi:hypothetical protein